MMARHDTPLLHACILSRQYIFAPYPRLSLSIGVHCVRAEGRAFSSRRKASSAAPSALLHASVKLFVLRHATTHHV